MQPVETAATISLQVKLLVAVLAITLTVLGFLARSWFSAITTLLKDIRNELQFIGKDGAVKGEQIKTLQEANVTTNNRLNDHSLRIRELEIRNPVK